MAHDERIIQSIAAHCRSLEALSIPWDQMIPDLVERIADSCRNLLELDLPSRRLISNFDSDIWETDSESDLESDEEEEIEEEEDYQPHSNTHEQAAASSHHGSQERAVEKLLRQCQNLCSLGFPHSNWLPTGANSERVEQRWRKLVPDLARPPRDELPK
ncbi:hypothetical protein HK102_005499, partial [Quaeritorhiza haematococci]